MVLGPVSSDLSLQDCFPATGFSRPGWDWCFNLVLILSAGCEIIKKALSAVFYHSAAKCNKPPAHNFKKEIIVPIFGKFYI